MRGLLQEKVPKIRITDLDKPKQRLGSGPSWITSSLQQPFVSGVVDSSRSVMHVLYTVSCDISYTHQLDLNLANLEATVEVG